MRSIISKCWICTAIKEGSSLYTRYAPDSACEGTGPSVLPSVLGGSLQPALAFMSGTVNSSIVLGDHGSELVHGACATHGADASSDACSSITDCVQSGHPSRREARGKACCEGILVEFPHGSNPHLSYPFGLHSERDIPWDYYSTGDKFYIQAKKCRKPVINKGSACKDCRGLTSLPLYIGIMDRIRHGVHENTPLVYHGVGGIVEIIRRKTEQIEQLRLTKLSKKRHAEAQSGEGAKAEMAPEKKAHLDE